VSTCLSAGTVPDLETPGKKPKLRVAYISWVAPHTQRGGGPLAMYRHFVLHDDVDLLVYSTGLLHEELAQGHEMPRHRAIKRLQNTRLTRWVRQFFILVEPYLWCRQLEPLLREFRPDVVFTVADPADSWCAYLVSKRLGLPLAVNFQDWWPSSNYSGAYERPFPVVRKIMARRFRKLHREAAVVFATSHGMLKWLGERPGARVLFPTGAPRTEGKSPSFALNNADGPLTIAYAGQIPRATYGEQVLQVAKILDRKDSKLRLQVYAPRGEKDIEVATALEKIGCYAGFLPGHQLLEELSQCDVLLAVMTFDAGLTLFVQTSFTTKILDYAAVGRPIVIWAPEYAAPVQLARRTGFALTCTDPDAESLVRTIEELRSPARYEAATRAAWEAGQTLFKHEAIHQVLLDGLGEAAARRVP
jgi:hypothetical protein